MPATPIAYDLLAAFVAVAEAESFSKAAVRLGVTKGTVSRAIARLERRLGAELLHRTTHHVALSTAGVALYERTAPHLAALGRAVGELPESAAEPSGELRITAPHDVAAIILPELIAQFSRRYPDIQFDLRVTNARLDLVRDKIDLAIRAGGNKLADSSLKARRLGSAGTRFYAAPSYVARRGAPRAFADPKHEWIVLGSRSRFFGAPKDFRPRMTVDDIIVARNLALEGLGVTALPHFVAAESTAEGRLEALLPVRALMQAALYAVYPSSGQVPRKVTVFSEFLAARLKERSLDA
jgi:DNA-binding transcriptional LysR family regulator